MHRLLERGLIPPHIAVFSGLLFIGSLLIEPMAWILRQRLLACYLFRNMYFSTSVGRYQMSLAAFCKGCHGMVFKGLDP